VADLFTGDAAIVLLMAGFAILIAFPLQLALCFRAKKLFVRYLPTIIFSVLAITFYIMAITAKTWAAFAYLIIAAFSGVSLVFGGIALGIWAMVNLAKTRKTH